MKNFKKRLMIYMPCVGAFTWFSFSYESIIAGKHNSHLDQEVQVENGVSNVADSTSNMNYSHTKNRQK